MNVSEFVSLYREAFGEKAQLPLAFWYDDAPAGECKNANGCMFKRLAVARTGTVVSFDEQTIFCPGAKLYAGFAPMMPFLPQFVSYQEHYKRTPEDVVAFVESLELEPAMHRYLNFARVDRLESFERVEALMFYATADMLAGLCTWACFDNGDEHAVSSPFGSGCSSVIALALRENRRCGSRCFIGGFDPSVRPYFRAGELAFIIPASRLGQMLTTMRQSCLYGTHAWEAVKKRIER